LPKPLVVHGPCGGIGRRDRLKIGFRKECWFDSGQGHHFFIHHWSRLIAFGANQLDFSRFLPYFWLQAFTAIHQHPHILLVSLLVEGSD
jgi:hypothetical protein